MITLFKFGGRLTPPMNGHLPVVVSPETPSPATSRTTLTSVAGRSLAAEDGLAVPLVLVRACSRVRGVW